MGKLIYEGSRTAEDERISDGWVLSYGRALRPGSAEHKEAVAEAFRRGDTQEVRKLLAQLPKPLAKQ